MTAPRDIDDYRASIEEALVYADHSHTFEDVRDMVHAGRLQFWPGAHSVIITEILDYPRYKALNYFLAGGGSLAEMEAMTPGIEAWARSMGCDRAVMTGRLGWERTFITRDGWRQKPLAVYEKTLSVEGR